MKHRVLVADDEARSVELVVRILRHFAEVSTASSAEEAWKIVQDGSVDLVISDQRMPGTSGVELLSRVAEFDDAIGRILMTGYTDLESIIAAINRGRIHAYLTKPCDPIQVRERVESVLRRVDHVRARERLIQQIGLMKREGGDGSPGQA